MAESAELTELQRVRSGTIDVVVLSPRDALRHGKDDFVIEFKSADGSLVDVGDVRATASMPMSGDADVRKRHRSANRCAWPLSCGGRLRHGGHVAADVEWDGPQGKGSVAFSGSVQ